MVCFVHFDFDMCFAPQRRALFEHLNFQKCSERGVFCCRRLLFWLWRWDQLVLQQLDEEEVEVAAPWWSAPEVSARGLGGLWFLPCWGRSWWRSSCLLAST